MSDTVTDGLKHDGGKARLDLEHRNRRLKETFKDELYNGAFAEWEFVEDTEGKRDFYLEKDGIRLIFDDKKCIGWYKPKIKKSAYSTLMGI